jgi:hypothetical protein
MERENDMVMTTFKWIALRMVMTTIGRWSAFAEAFKRFMVYYAVQRRGEEKYVASSRFFSWDQLRSDRR